MLWSNKPETITSDVVANTPVLAKMTVQTPGRFAVGCHHANGSPVNVRLQVVLHNRGATAAVVNIHRNAQGYHKFSGQHGHEVALSGRDCATAWFAAVGGGSLLIPALSFAVLEVGPALGLEGGPLTTNGIASAMIEFESSTSLTAFVVAGNGPFDWDSLNNELRWAQAPRHLRGTVPAYRMVTEYASPEAEPVVVRVPNDDILRERYLYLNPLQPPPPPPDPTWWQRVTDEMVPGAEADFVGEYHVEQVIRLFAVNETADLNYVSVVLNARGGHYGGAYWAANAGVMSVAPACEQLPPESPVNLGLLLEHKDGLRVPKFGVPPGGPHLIEFRFMSGGGSNLPVHFVAFPCTPFVGELP